MPNQEDVAVTVLPGRVIYVGGSHFAFGAGETVRLPKAHADELITRGEVQAVNSAPEAKPAV